MTALAETRWMIQPNDPERARVLAQAVGISPITAQLLLNRGITTPKAAQEFLYPSLSQLHSPYGLADMDRAVATRVAAMEAGLPITIYGDYDVDGTSSAALLINVFRRLGVSHVDYYIPHRIDEGYGLNEAAIYDLAQRGSKLLITVDCGVTAVEEVALAQRLGMQVVVTDHHQPGRELPAAEAVIDPHRSDCRYPFPHLAGVGVAFKLAQALLHTVGGAPDRWDEVGTEWLDLVALGTIADVASVHGENRAIIKYGLERMAASDNLGIQALMEVARVTPETLSATTVSFGLAPRINAMGRMDDAGKVVEMLTTADYARAKEIAETLDEYNASRRSLEAEILQEAIALVEESKSYLTDKVLVVAKEGWHHGVIGIVASRLVERYYRPVIVVALEDGIGKGSARSIDGFDLFAALKECHEVLVGYGGHTMAAGISLRQDKLTELRQRINQVADQWLTPEDLIPRLLAEAEVALSDLSFRLVEELNLFAPFGPDNPPPVLTSRGVPLREVRAVGKEHRHLQLYFAPETGIRQGIAFGFGAMKEDLLHLSHVDIAYCPDINEFNGERSLQPKIKDIKIAQEYLRASLLSRISDRFQGLPESTAYDHVEAFGLLEGEGTPAPALSDCRWLDGRGENKGDYLRDVIGASANPLVIWVNRVGFACALADNIAAAFPGLSGGITVYSHQMEQSLQDECLCYHQELPWRVIVTDADQLPSSLLGPHPDLLVYHLPPSPYYLWHLAQQCQSRQGAVHLLFDEMDSTQARQLLAWSWPDADQLRRIYVELYRLCTVGVAEPLEELFLDIGPRLRLTRQGLLRALEVFVELGLCQFSETGLVLGEAPKNRLDLELSVRYNNVVQSRERMEKWIESASQRPMSLLRQMLAKLAEAV